MDSAARQLLPRALDSFCCGCSLEFGVQVISVVHFAISLLLLGGISSDIVWGLNTYAFWYRGDTTLGTILAAFLLAGLPMIGAGLWGTIAKSESMVRVYWYYAVVSYGVLLVYEVADLMVSGPCKILAQGNFFQNGGPAFTCGILRIANVVVVVILTAVPFYFLYVILSYCDDMAFGWSAPNLHDLAAGSDHFYRPWLYKSKQDDMCKQYLANATEANGYGNVERGGTYGAVYTKAAAQGLGGSKQIFGGKYHDMEYPRRI